MSYERDWAALRRQRGACPDEEKLKNYLSGELTTAEQTDIANHIELCGLCDLYLSRLTPADVQIPAERWKPIEARLERALAETPSEPQFPGSGFTLGRFLRHPALGYAFALLLCIPAYRGLIQDRQQPPPAPTEPVADRPIGITAIRVLDFPAGTRGAADARREVQLSREDKILGLSFFVPDRSQSGWRYDAEVLNAASEEVTQASDVRSQDGLGNFLFVVGAELLPAGQYELRIRETRPPSGQGMEHRFPFTIRR